MSTQRYSARPHPIKTLLTWVKSGEIAIGAKKYDGITDFGDFLEERCNLMALQSKAWFEVL